MATSVPIQDLTTATSLEDVDVFVIEQNGTAKKLQGATLKNYIDRNVVAIDAFQLEYGAKPTAEFDRITGKLRLGVPKGNSIVSIALNNEGKIVYTFADGTSRAFERIKGDTGKSAYQYAVENGYTGSETDFATLQINLYQASLNEDERVQAEAKRKSDYAYMMDRLNNKMNDIDSLVNKVDCRITGTTLILNMSDVDVVGTTLML